MQNEARQQDLLTAGSTARRPRARSRPRPYAGMPRSGPTYDTKPGRATGVAPGRAHRQWTPLARSLLATGDHWTLAIALQLAPGAVRLTRLHARLPGISTGVLDRHLQQMVALGLLSRTRFREMPPRVEFELTDAGRELLPIAGALARWGMCHVWSAPREGERVDVSALLRLLPVLVEEETNLPDGTLETVLDVLEASERATRYVFEIVRGRLRATEETIHAPSACVTGHANAWIAALGPEREYGKLRFTGDEQLARRVLEARAGRM